MARGDKSAYTDKQKRQAEHIEESYEKRGVSPKKAAARAWATVNKQDGGGKKTGSGRGKKRRPIRHPRRTASKKKATRTTSSTRSKKKATRTRSRTRKATARRTRTSSTKKKSSSSS